MVLGLGFLLLISMVITTALEAFAGAIGQYLPVPKFLMIAFSVLITFFVVTLLFAMIFKFLPDVKVRWRHVWIGAVTTALLFTIGKYLLALYLGREGTASAYGAAGSVIVIMLWVYYSSVILFFGAEFTQVYARKSGAKIVPSRYAVPVTGRARAQQGMAVEEKHQPQLAVAVATQTATERQTAAKEIRHPWRHMAVAVGVGALTGWWLRRDAVRQG
jgi:membrane protein